MDGRLGGGGGNGSILLMKRYQRATAGMTDNGLLLGRDNAGRLLEENPGNGRWTTSNRRSNISR